MSYVILILASLVMAAFLGHSVHWFLHQKWSGFFNKGHMEHHRRKYPPGNLVSERYRHVKWYNDGVLLFAPAFVLVSMAVGLGSWFLGLPAWTVVTVCLTILGFGLFNDHVHTSFHVKKHWLMRFTAWHRWRDLHYVHHHNMKVNFGIFSFTYDRLFGTFRVNGAKRVR